MKPGDFVRVKDAALGGRAWLYEWDDGRGLVGIDATLDSNDVALVLESRRNPGRRFSEACLSKLLTSHGVWWVEEEWLEIAE